MRTTRLTTRLTRVMLEPRRLKKKASTAATTVTATETSAVSISSERILGMRSMASASGIRLETIHCIAAGKEATPSRRLNSETRDAPANTAISTRKTSV